MRVNILTLVGAVSLATASPLGAGAAPFDLGLAAWGLEGYAKDNPVGPTTGGKGGEEVEVSTPEALVAAVAGNEPRTVYVKGKLTLPATARVGSNKSILGKGWNAELTKHGLLVENQTNVIIRNLKFSYVENGDNLALNNATRVWIDHNEFTSEFGLEIGPDFYDGQIDINRASDWVTVSWNYLHDHWKSSLVGNSDTNREQDFGHLHITYHHNYWRNSGTRGPAGRFGHQHVYNNVYEDFHFQALHSRSDNQMLVEGNVFRGDTREALSTYGLVIPDDSPNTCTCGDEELDGFANLGAKNDWGPASVNITQEGDFYEAEYGYKLTPLLLVKPIVWLGVGVGKIW